MAKADRTHLAGDASARRYERLTLNDRTAILMDDPPGDGAGLVPFVEVADFLRQSDLSAPEIYARDDTSGLMLLEDFGDASFAKVIAADPTKERPLFEAAVDVLIDLHGTPCPPFVTPYSAK